MQHPCDLGSHGYASGWNTHYHGMTTPEFLEHAREHLAG
jgi:hypothetical protein